MIEYMTPNILLTFAALDTGLGDGANRAIVNAIMLVIVAFPLAFTPILMKVMGGIASSVGGMVNNRSKGIFDRAKNVGRKASSAQTGAWKGLARRTATAKGAEWQRQNKSWAHPRNVGAAILAGQPLFTPRQKLAMGQKGEAYEDAEVGLAKKDIEFRGIGGDKKALERYVSNNKSNPYAQIAAMSALAEIGGDKELGAMFAAPETRETAAKVISKSSKMREAAAPLYFEASGYANNLKAARAGEAVDATGQPVSPANAEAFATDEGRKLRETKANEQLSQSYVLGLKPAQLAARSYTRDASGTVHAQTLDPATSGITGLEKSLSGGTPELANVVHGILNNRRLTEKINAEQRMAFEDIINRATIGGWTPPPPTP